MKTPKPISPTEFAREIIAHVGDAVGEAAYESVRNPWDQAVQKRLNRYRKLGVQDIAGRWADDDFNDAELFRDLMGDKVIDLCGNDSTLQKEVLLEITRIGHSAAKTAAQKMLKEMPQN